MNFPEDIETLNVKVAEVLVPILVRLLLDKKMLLLKK